MAIRPDKERAKRILLEEAEAAHSTPGPEKWEHMIEEISAVCETSSKTHIAFLGTALLAKATDLRVDPRSVKAGSQMQGAYSARTFGHSTLVPLAPEIEVDLGVTGREPLNNQPYFRIDRATLEEMLPLVQDRRLVKTLDKILGEVEKIANEDEARAALRAFIKVRRKYAPVYPLLAAPVSGVRVPHLLSAIQDFVLRKSEGGRRAQAVVAGVLDAVFGVDRVHAGRINDPDRHIPGDVAVSGIAGMGGWDRVFEVRDKLVAHSDLILFASKAAQEGIPIAAVVAVAAGQQAVPVSEAKQWARSKGIELIVFLDWAAFVSQAVLWSPTNEEETIQAAFVNRTGFIGDWFT